MAILIQNKKAYFNYEILEKFEAGLELKGFEVKSLKNGKGNIAGSHIIISGEEAYIMGMKIPPYQPTNAPKEYDQERLRKVLLRKKEIKYLLGKKQSAGLTLIPLKVYTARKLVKLEIALAKGKKKRDKREKIKKRESERKIERTLKWG
jgi:SsrA-binding protein